MTDDRNPEGVDEMKSVTQRCKYCRTDYEDTHKYFGNGWICSSCWSVYEFDDGVDCKPPSPKSDEYGAEQIKQVDARKVRLMDKIRKHRLACASEETAHAKQPNIRQYWSRRIGRNTLFEP